MKLSAISADLALRLYPFVNTDPGRYYICGIHLEPAKAGTPGGWLVATDGHALGVFRDQDAAILDHCTVSLSKDTLKHCKPSRSSPTTSRRWLVVNHETGNIAVIEAHEAAQASVVVGLYENNKQIVAVQPGQNIIDGTFPDWRRILPKWPAKNFVPQTYNADLLGRFGHLQWDGMKGIEVLASEEGSPALVLTPHPDFVGVLMPIRQPEGYQERVSGLMSEARNG